MRTTILLLFIALLLCQPQRIGAQSTQDWETYVDVTRINGHFDQGDQILLATDGGISVYDKASKQITERWTRATHGLPSNMIEAIVKDPQTQQLIIGTYDLGVFRQSGSEVGNWEPVSLPESVNTDNLLTYCLAHDDQNRLLVGNNKGLFIQANNGEWIHYGPNQTDNFLHAVWEMLTMPNGTVYIAGNLTMKITEGDVSIHAPVTFDLENTDSLLIAYGDRKLHLAPNGDLWNTSDLGQIARYTAEGEWELYGAPFNNLDLSFSIFHNNFLDTEGRLHVQTFSDDYYRFEEGEFLPIELPPGMAELENIFLNGNEMIGQLNGSLYSADVDGNSLLAGAMGNWPWAERVDNLFNDLEDNSWAKYGNSQIINLSQGDILDMPEDAEGNSSYRNIHFTDTEGGDLWLQSSNTLLHWRERQELIEYPFAPNNTSTSTWTRSSLVTDNGTPWYVTDEREIYTLINGEWVRQMEVDDNQFISSLIPFPSNRVLVTILSFSGPNEAWLLGPGIAEPYSFGDDFNWDNYWSPFPGEELGSTWFYDHNNYRVVNYYQGVSTELDLPAEWQGSQLINSFQEKDGNLLISSDELVAIYNGSSWAVYNQQNAPIETTDISSARLDADGVLRISHGSFRRAMEVLQTDMVASTEENSLVAAGSAIKVFPNPASEWISFPSEQPNDYQIYNNLGQLILVGKSQAGSTKVNLAQLTPGVYHLRSGHRAASFIVER